MYSSMLVGTDGSETAEVAVTAALELAGLFGSTVHVVNVYRPLGHGTAVPEVAVAYPQDAEPETAATALAEEVAAKARQEGLEVRTHVVMGEVADQIVAYAESEGIDLIVVGNKGMHGLRRILGSIPNAVAHKATCSVLIVKTT